MATKLKSVKYMHPSVQALPADVPAIPGDQDPPSPQPHKPLKNIHSLPTLETVTATKLKVVEDVAGIVPAPLPAFDPAPTRKRHAGWTATRQRKFIEHLALTGHVGEAAAVVGLSSSSAYRLRDRAGADIFARAWDAALRLAPTRLVAIGLDRAINGRVERHYRNGELVMERRIPSDYLLTWFISRLDPATFGSPTAKALAAATGDPREKARQELPGLIASFADVPEEDCPTEGIDFLDDRLGETGSGEPIGDHDRA